MWFTTIVYSFLLHLKIIMINEECEDDDEVRDQCIICLNTSSSPMHECRYNTLIMHYS